MLARFTRSERQRSRGDTVVHGQYPSRLRGQDGRNAPDALVARGAVGGDGHHARAAGAGTGEHHVAMHPRFARLKRQLARGDAVVRGQEQGGLHGATRCRGAASAAATAAGQGNDHHRAPCDRRRAKSPVTHFHVLVRGLPAERLAIQSEREYARVGNPMKPGIRPPGRSAMQHESWLQARSECRIAPSATSNCRTCASESSEGRRIPPSLHGYDRKRRTDRGRVRRSPRRDRQTQLNSRLRGNDGKGPSGRRRSDYHSRLRGK